MKLNNYQREGFIRTVMDSLPKVNEKEMLAEIQKDLVASMSPECRKLYRTNPKALNNTYQYFSVLQRNASFVIGDADQHKVFAPYLERANAVAAARAKLGHVVRGCSTLKRLQTALPEFIRFMPTEVEPSKYPIAVANVVADLVKLGWK
jgi:hypothetical protein